MTRLKTVLTDGRFIRGTAVGLVALIIAFFIYQNTGLIISNRLARAVAVTPIVIPTPVLVEENAQSDLLFTGETIVGRIEAGAYPLWTFTGLEGDLIDILVQSNGDTENDFNIVVELFAPNGDQILRLDDADEGLPELVRSLPLPATGEYSLWLSDDEFEEAGGYTVTVLTDRVKATHPLRMGIGRTVLGESVEGEYQFWVFSGNAQQRISISLIPFGNLDRNYEPYFELYSPRGEKIIGANTDDTGQSLILREIELPETGTYTIWVGETDFDDTGQYLLSVQFNQGKLIDCRRTLPCGVNEAP